MVRLKGCDIITNKIWNWLIDNLLDRRVSASKLVKPKDLVISNASLEDIKRGINKIYNEVYGGVNKNE